ncbi:PepSY domain-containing protein [Cellvibrio mixtus]|uniref:PepSY domain-containing protein n=1 Tax=Cellvibrio mixtus TaxID=39650 RepID=UPI000586D9A5|nr:PepSY domain-containing protein [Cellvibrio mixtus]
MKFTPITRFIPPLASTLLALALMATLPAIAEPDLLDGDMGLQSSSPGNGMIDSGNINSEPAPPKITPAQAADLVRRATGGQVMSINSQQTETGVIYGVKVLNSGRMRVVRVDGQTGQILNN